MSIDYLRIKDKLNQSKDYFLIIDRILDKESNNLKSDIEQQMVAERAFEIISQIIIDVCTHIVAKMRLSTPSNYADCINKLVENNIIQPEYKQKLKNLIRMRNLIVH